MTSGRHATTRMVWILGAAWLAASCGGDSSDAPEPAAVDGWEIEASAVSFDGSTASASFTARGTGMRAFGACILADLHGGKACDTAADCATGAVVTLDAEHHDYCVAAGGESRKTCWVRNGADPAWCNKKPPPGRAAGTYTTPSVAAAQLTAGGAKTRWIAIACLNAGTYPAFADGPLPPCASTDPASASYQAVATSQASSFTAP